MEVIPYSYLLNTWVSISGCLYSKRASNFSRSATIDYRVVANKISCNTKCIVDAPLCLFDHHFVTYSEKRCTGIYLQVSLNSKLLMIFNKVYSANSTMAHEPPANISHSGSGENIPKGKTDNSSFSYLPGQDHVFPFLKL